jgi:Cu-Zn family superoxide dismutase
MKPVFAPVLALTLVLAACQGQTLGNTEQAVPAQELATADLSDSDGNKLGIVTLFRADSTASLEVDLQGIEPGTKAFHLHSVGACEGPDFTSAGGHLNPEGKAHGKLSDGGKHLGDLPNLDISDDGSVRVTIKIEGAAGEIVNAIQDEDGTAVMVHAGPDDYKSDPAGAAGPRIACGVLRPI